MVLFFVLIGSFHLIHLMFDDYVLYLLESLHCQERANELMRAMKGEGTPGEIHLIQEIELIAHGIRLETNTESLFVTKIVVFISSVGNVTWR